MKKKKIDIRLQHHFICNECTRRTGWEKIFYNDDDNVCLDCGSKDTSKLLQARLKAEIIVV